MAADRPAASGDEFECDPIDLGLPASIDAERELEMEREVLGSSVRQWAANEARSAASGRRLSPAEKVARAAARVVDSIGPDEIAHAREVQGRVKGGCGRYFITNARIVALADAVEAWRG